MIYNTNLYYYNYYYHYYYYLILVEYFESFFFLITYVNVYALNLVISHKINIFCS